MEYLKAAIDRVVNSPVIFTTYMNAIMKELREKLYKIPIDRDI
jgi:hypothetical protein